MHLGLSANILGTTCQILLAVQDENGTLVRRTVAIGTRQHKATDELSHPRGLASLAELPLGIYWH